MLVHAHSHTGLPRLRKEYLSTLLEYLMEPQHSEPFVVKMKFAYSRQRALVITVTVGSHLGKH